MQELVEAIYKHLEDLDQELTGIQQGLDVDPTLEASINSEITQVYNIWFSKACSECGKICLYTNFFKDGYDFFPTFVETIRKWLESGGEEAAPEREWVHDSLLNFFKSLKALSEKAISNIREYIDGAELELYRYTHKRSRNRIHKLLYGEQFLLDLIKVTNCDLNCSADYNLINHLLDISDRATNHEYFEKIDSSIRKALSLKSRFLAIKIAFRHRRDVIKFTDYDEISETISIEDLKDNEFLEWYDKISYHYLGDHSKAAKVTNKAELNYQKNSESCLLYDLHGVVKSAKDETFAYARLDAIVARYESRFDSYLKACDSEFDRYGCKINRLYFLNNQFSSQIDRLIQSNDFSINSLRLVISRCEDIEMVHESNQIHNYFPYFKTISYANYCIDKLFESKTYLDDYNSEYEVLFKKINGFADKARKSFLYMKRNQSRVFQLPIDECRLAKAYNIIVYSSFILPLQYDNVQENEIDLPISKFNSQRLVLQNLDIIINAKKIIDDQVRSLDDNVKDAQAQIKNGDRKSMEVISIFAAIALFSTGSIQIFQMKDIKPENALQYILVVGICFGYFVWLIRGVFYGYGFKSGLLNAITMILGPLIAIYGLAYFLGWISAPKLPTIFSKSSKSDTMIVKPVLKVDKYKVVPVGSTGDLLPKMGII